MGQHSSICPSTGLECSVRAYIIDEVQAAESIARDLETNEETRNVSLVTLRAGELMLVSLGCSETDCSAGLNAARMALNPLNFVEFARHNAINSGN